MGNRHTNFNPICIEKDWELKKRPMTESVAIEEGVPVYRVGDGKHTSCTHATANFEGILAEPITATDTDYATASKLKAVWVPRTISAEAECAITGTLTAGDIGKSLKFHTDGKSVAQAEAGTQASITAFLSASRGICKFNQAIS